MTRETVEEMIARLDIRRWSRVNGKGGPVLVRGAVGPWGRPVAYRHPHGGLDAETTPIAALLRAWALQALAYEARDPLDDFRRGLFRDPAWFAEACANGDAADALWGFLGRADYERLLLIVSGEREGERYGDHGERRAPPRAQDGGLPDGRAHVSGGGGAALGRDRPAARPGDEGGA